MAVCLASCATVGPAPKSAEQVLAPVTQALACPAPPANLTTPQPVPLPPKLTVGSYRAVPRYARTLLAWIETDLDRSAARERWQAEMCGTAIQMTRYP